MVSGVDLKAFGVDLGALGTPDSDDLGGPEMLRLLVEIKNSVKAK